MPNKLDHYEQQWPKIGQGGSSHRVKLTQQRIYKNINEIILVPLDPTGLIRQRLSATDTVNAGVHGSRLKGGFQPDATHASV